MAKLYVVPTPVGNLEDMTFRAISVLREVDCILAEDTRTSGILLKHFDIHTRMSFEILFDIEHCPICKTNIPFFILKIYVSANA